MKATHQLIGHLSIGVGHCFRILQCGVFFRVEKVALAPSFECFDLAVEPARSASVAKLMSTQKRHQLICETRTVAKERSTGSSGLLRRSTTAHTAAMAMNSLGTRAHSKAGLRTWPYLRF
jgi:hypothetical protein